MTIARRPQLLDTRDLLFMAAAMALGLALRLRWYSGFGLGDDVNFLYFIRNAMSSGAVSLQGYGYRFVWWIPTAALARLVGLHETALIAPITTASVLGIGVVYALGKHFAGRAGAVVAALLLIVQPLDVAWSTMLANDLVASVFIGATVLAFARAVALDPGAGRHRWFAGAAVALLLAYHSKITALAVVPALVVIAWRRRRTLWPDAAAFVLVAIVLFGGSLLASYALHGTPFAPYRGELELAGLTSPDAAMQRRLSPEMFWRYPRFMFWHERDGEWLYGAQPIAVGAFIVVGGAFALAGPAEPLAWLVAVFVVMQFQMIERNDTWLVPFRNIRHSHILVYPVVVVLASYLVVLRARRRWPAELLLAILLAFGLYQSIVVASKTHATFGDEREAVRFLGTLPPGPVYSDQHLVIWSEITDLRSGGFTFHVLPANFPDRLQAVGRIERGYLVTGGGRDPWYGCYECIPTTLEVDPMRFQKLREWPGPSHPQPWRHEPLRVWMRRSDTVN